MLLLESSADEMGISLALAERLAGRSDGGALDAGTLPITDLDTLLLEQRRLLLGDEVHPWALCPEADCGAQIDISFRISAYLAHHRPRMPRTVEPLKEEPGWFRLRCSEVKFRLVTANDLVAVKGISNPERALARRTIRPEGISKREMKLSQQALESLSPCLSQELEGSCPECGKKLLFFFQPRSYIQRELQHETAFLYEDVHLLATRYHWPEEKILSLPRMRRVQYAELALREGA